MNRSDGKRLIRASLSDSNKQMDFLFTGFRLHLNNLFPFLAREACESFCSTNSSPRLEINYMTHSSRFIAHVDNYIASARHKCVILSQLLSFYVIVNVINHIYWLSLWINFLFNYLNMLCLLLQALFTNRNTVDICSTL